MAFKRAKIIRGIKKWLDELDKTIAVTHAYLFGSYAKGHPTQWSDIDVAIISPRFKGVRFYDHKMLIPYLRGMPGLLEIHPFRREDFNTKNLFAKEIIRTGIKIK